MTDILLLILGILLILGGIAGSVLPILPGPPLAFAGMLLLRFTDYVEPTRQESYDNLLWIFAFVVIVISIIDYLVPVWGTKKFGGSRAGTWGAAIGVIVGLFFAPIGLILGPFIGAVLGEMLTGRDEKTSLKAGFGSLIGFLFGVAMKISVSVLIAFYFLREALAGQI